MRTIYSLSELGKKVATVKGNRAISTKNLKQKMVSIKECGLLVPIIIVKGEDAFQEGLTLVDAESGKELSENEVSDYVVIIEGQHRNTAIELLKEKDKKDNTSFAPSETLFMYAENPKGCSIKKLISELNRTSIVWDGKDYVTGAALCNPTDELLAFAKELADLKSTKSNDGLPSNGYPVSTISKLTTFGSSLDKEKLCNCMDEGAECLPTANIGRARKILESARKVGFNDKYLAHKYLINWVIDESNKQRIDDICNIIEGLQPEEVTSIMKIKGDNYIADIRNAVSAGKSDE